MEKNWAHFVDQHRLQVLQFSVHLIDLLSIILGCHGFAKTQRAVVCQGVSRALNSCRDLFWYKFGFGASSQSKH